MGEGGWSALEIIIVLILVLALLGRVFGTSNNSVKVPDIATYKGKKETLSTPPSFNDCGKVLVTAPKPSEKVSVTTPGILVQGSLNNCNIIPVEPETFSVTIVDAYATVVAEPVSIPIALNKDTIVFSRYVPLVVTPRTGTGYVIITRISNTGVQQSGSGARIPIRFVN